VTRAALPFVPLAPLAAALGLLTWVAPTTSEAFCGFYVASAGSDALSNQATVVVLMRDGTRTVLSMRNNYQGAPQDFALVVPVPTLLAERDVNVIDTKVFERVDRLSAPRLVEYWERDPCYVEEAGCADASCEGEAAEEEEELGVKVEAAFAVGEYEIAILSAKDSTGLETWLKRKKYAIPSGAEPLLRPYVESGSKFFVARVDASKVAFDEQGRTMLSPLRISYESPEFSLPVRLGLINAAPDQKQDLLVHILARGTRYQVANYDNVAIPTNLDVEDEVRHGFGSFYAALFDHTLAQHPNAIVTEYAWSAGTCDPCPDAPLSLEELVTFGADLLPAYAKLFNDGRAPEEAQWKLPKEFVLTRLHARYDASSLAEDLVFEVAPPLIGGREFPSSDRQLGQGAVEQGAVEDPNGQNNFQARYAIRHPWTKKIACEAPKRNVWIGEDVQPPNDLTFVERDADLTALIIEEGAAKRIASEAGPFPSKPDPESAASSGGCAHCSAEPDNRDPLALLASFGMLGLLGVAARRKNRDRC
jgi:MYXO-CTERM domain-containing protein